MTRAKCCEQLTKQENQQSRRIINIGLEVDKVQPSSADNSTACENFDKRGQCANNVNSTNQSSYNMSNQATRSVVLNGKKYQPTLKIQKLSKVVTDCCKVNGHIQC